MELINLLDRPGREYTPFPFWFLNDELTADELRRQLQDFAAHGVYGVVLHPRIGLPRTMPYLSEAFFDAIEAAVREAERLGMRVILYDEGMYPSGSACGQVVAANPDYASRGIDLLPPDAALEEGDKLLARTPGGLLVSRFTRGTIRGIHFGQDDGEPDAPPSTDLLNPDAVELFIRLTHDAYYKRLKQWFGTTVIAFFTDEPSIMGRNPRTPFAWTKGFEDAFTAAGGVLADLAALFCGEENASTRLYHRMILEMEGEVYYRRLSDWCAGHGIALVGHPHQSDDIEVERWFQIPGQDLALRWVAPEKPDAGIDGMMGHCSADAALLMGCRRNANECFGACNRGGNPWQLSGGDIKWYLDWLAVRGVNLFIPHAFYYSIEGARKDERPPDVGPHSSWWPRYRLWSDYIRRLSALMTDAEVRVRVALPCRNRDLHPETAAALERAQISCCCLPESVWPDCHIEDGRLHCRGLVFDAVAGDAAWFPALPHWGDAAFDRAVTPDCVCTPPQPALRVRRFARCGAECWFLVNEGEESIEASVTFPGAERLGGYDLWAGRAFRLAAGDAASITLPRRGSLLVFACSAADWAGLPARPADILLPEAAFRLTEERPDAVQKVYEADYPVDALPDGGRLLLPVQAEELCELTVNGQDAGAAFWSPCAFEVGGLLRPGANRLRLTVTGSLANRYGERPVPYGLGVREAE